MPSCAACQKAFTKEQRGLKCTLCDERRVAEPAYYCDRACQKQHWPEHKAFHAQLAATEADVKRCEALQMRSMAYARLGDGPSPSADDLRQALRDRRRIADMYKEGSSERLRDLRVAQKIEARLRARIAADLAAMNLAER